MPLIIVSAIQRELILHVFAFLGTVNISMRFLRQKIFYKATMNGQLLPSCYGEPARYITLYGLLHITLYGVLHNITLYGVLYITFYCVLSATISILNVRSPIRF